MTDIGHYSGDLMIVDKEIRLENGKYPTSSLFFKQA